MTEFNWKKTVLSLYRENNEHPETEAFAVVKTRNLHFIKSEIGAFEGKIQDFFCLMGDVDSISSTGHYVVCWFDDAEDDFYKAFRRLSGVTFPSGINYVTDKRDKRTYNGEFKAKHAKTT